MADGKGCKCAAHSEAECGCDADWTPQEVYDLRAMNAAVYGLLADIRAAVGDPTGKLMQDELVAHCRSLRLTDEEREVLATVRDIYASHDDDDSCNRIAAVIDGLLERLG